MARKGFLSLDYLIGLILSVVALVIIINILAPLLFYEPTNMEIAEENIASMQEFIAFSEEQDTESVGQCFNFFRLHNQETFQLSSNEQKYVIIIEPDGISLAKNSYLSQIKKTGSLEGVPLQKTKSFSSEIELTYDTTYQGNNFLYGASFGLFGDADERIRYGDREIGFIVLHPKFDEDEYHYQGYFFYEEPQLPSTCDSPPSERYARKHCTSEQYMSSEIRYATYDPVNDFLFFPTTDLSTSLARADLCMREQDERTQLKEFYRSTYLENIDSMNNKITLSMQGDGASESFVWADGAICRNEGMKQPCSDFFPAEPRDYGDFVFRVLKFANDRGYEVKVSSVENLCFSEVEKQEYRFNQLFDDGFGYALDDVFYSASRVNNPARAQIRNINESFKDTAYRFFSGHDESVNGFSGPQTRVSFYRDGKMWFYVPETQPENYRLPAGAFYAVSEDFLRKRIVDREQVFYFNKEEISFESSTVSSEGEGEDRLIHQTEITLNGRTYDIFLSHQQYTAIQSYGTCEESS